jgi:pimeloyl-ACP methyl ester carboxylesterase
MRFAMGNVLRERGFGEPDVARALDARARIERAYRAGDIADARAVIGSVQDEAWFPFAYLPTVEDVEHPEPFEIDLDVGELFARIRVPTLAIYGSWDRWVPVDPSVDAWRSAFAGRGELLRVVRVPEAGHMMTTPIDREDLNEEGPVSPTYAEAMTRWLPGALV